MQILLTIVLCKRKLKWKKKKKKEKKSDRSLVEEEKTNDLRWKMNLMISNKLSFSEKSRKDKNHNNLLLHAHTYRRITVRNVDDSVVCDI